MGVTTIAYEDIERFFDYMERLEVVANAARVERKMMRALPEHIIQELYGLGLPELAMQHLSMTLDALDEEEGDSAE